MSKPGLVPEVLLTSKTSSSEKHVLAQAQEWCRLGRPFWRYWSATSKYFFSFPTVFLYIFHLLVSAMQIWSFSWMMQKICAMIPLFIAVRLFTSASCCRRCHCLKLLWCQKSQWRQRCVSMQGTLTAFKFCWTCLGMSWPSIAKPRGVSMMLMMWVTCVYFLLLMVHSIFSALLRAWWIPWATPAAYAWKLQMLVTTRLGLTGRPSHFFLQRPTFVDRRKDLCYVGRFVQSLSRQTQVCACRGSCLPKSCNMNQHVAM